METLYTSIRNKLTPLFNLAILMNNKTDLDDTKENIIIKNEAKQAVENLNIIRNHINQMEEDQQHLKVGYDALKCLTEVFFNKSEILKEENDNLKK